MLEVKGYVDSDLIVAKIDDLSLRGRQGKIQCPVCPQQGKQHIKDKCLSVNLDKEVFKCHKCGWQGGWTKFGNKKKYQIPDTSNQTKLKLKHLQLFSKRMITQDVLIRNKVATAVNPKNGNSDWFAFTYFDADHPVKVKYKKVCEGGSKKIFQEANCIPWIYKYNDLLHQEEIMICEGEEEALIWEVAGFKHASSVDAGAPNENDQNIDGKLECITNCFHVFEEAKVIYLALDNDPNGKRLERELIKRFGAEKCKKVDFSPYKDANEYALNVGIKSLLDLKNDAKYVPIEGLFMCDHFNDEITYHYINGQIKGTETYFPDLNRYWTWRPGEVNVWTGYNNEGKSLYLRQLQIAKSAAENWRHVVFAPEEYPISEWYTDIIESYIGKSADKSQLTKNNYMSEEEFREGFLFANEHFFNIYPPLIHGIEELLDLASYSVRKYNIKTVTLDPYNQIHHKMRSGEREDLYISRFMATLKKFAIDHMVAFSLIAHQRTPVIAEGKNFPKPNLFLIKGGGTFADKADNVISVWRENRNTDPYDNRVRIIIQKIKKQKLTGVPGECAFTYNRDRNQFATMMGTYPIQKIRDERLFNFEKSRLIQHELDFPKPRDVPF